MSDLCLCGGVVVVVVVVVVVGWPFRGGASTGLGLVGWLSLGARG